VVGKIATANIGTQRILRRPLTSFKVEGSSILDRDHMLDSDTPSLLVDAVDIRVRVDEDLLKQLTHIDVRIEWVDAPEFK
jgi:hypothetical protein